MRILSITTLFPNSTSPRFGIFIANRLNKLKHYKDVDINVVAPVPWFPLASMMSQFSHLKDVPESTHWRDLSVRHPKFLSIPGYGFGLKPKMIAKSILSSIKHDKSYDLIDAHYAYPDGAAAAIVAKQLNIPMVLSVRGSDINELPKNPSIKKAIQNTLRQSDHIISVSRPLASGVKELHPESLVTIIENGVDQQVFSYKEQVVKQNNLLLSVGNLIPLKGHHLVIEAIAEFPDLELIIIGSGPEHSHLTNLIQQKQLQERVKIMGNMEQADLANWYNKAAATLLVSANEGCPNVVLESIACGTPVIATRVGACEDLIDENDTGLFIDERSVSGVTSAIGQFQRLDFSREKIAKSAARFDWRAVCERQFQVYQSTISGWQQRA